MRCESGPAARFLEIVEWLANSKRAVHEDADVIGHALDIGKDVGGEKDGRPSVDNLIQHFIEKFAAGNDIQGGGRLIEDHQIGVRGESEDESDLPLRALRKGRYLFPGIQTEALKQPTGECMIPGGIKARSEFDDGCDA